VPSVVEMVKRSIGFGLGRTMISTICFDSSMSAGSGMNGANLSAVCDVFWFYLEGSLDLEGSATVLTCERGPTHSHI
jgi:hypothetical protein